MALLHVNSANGAPVSPFDTWAKAATTLGATAAVAVDGDEIFVHPSHAETLSATINFAGTQANPIKIICGTPGATSGITALQTTAQISVATSGSSLSVNGNLYIHGIQFRLTGSTGAAIFSFNTGATLTTIHFNECQFLGIATVGTGFNFCNSNTAQNEGYVMLTNCSVRYGATGHFLRFANRAQINGLTVLSGGVTPTSMFSYGSSGNENSAMVEMNGLDFSVLSNTAALNAATTKTTTVRYRNVKAPSGWTPSLFSATPLLGSRGELLNWASDDKNYRFWVEDRHGKAKDEIVVKRSTNAASDGTTSYSMRLETTSNVAFPILAFRSPPIIKRHAAAPGTTRTVAVQIAHDGSAAFSDKEVWLEVEYLGTAGFPLAKFTSDRAIYTNAAAAQPASGVAWDGATGTGPNGSTTWHRLQLETPAITVEEEGYLIGTVCMAVPSKTLFADPQLNVTVV